MKQQALAWLYGQLKRKRVSLGAAERKPNRSEAEVENIRHSIEILEYIIGVVIAKGEE